MLQLLQMHVCPVPVLPPHQLLVTQYWPSVMLASLVHELFACEPLQLSVAGSRQAPDKQLVPEPHTLPHAPQLFLSALESTQAPLQAICVPGQAHAPMLQVALVAHLVPHLPQLVVLLSTSTQAPLAPQVACPVGQMHALCQQL